MLTLLAKLKLKAIASYLILLQFLDGIFTYWGIKHFGTVEVEGNPFVKALVHEVGPEAGLILLKFLACSFIVIIVKRIKEQDYIKWWFLFVSTVYSGAIALWIFVFLREML